MDQPIYVVSSVDLDSTENTKSLVYFLSVTHRNNIIMQHIHEKALRNTCEY